MNEEQPEVVIRGDQVKRGDVVKVYKYSLHPFTVREVARDRSGWLNLLSPGRTYTSAYAVRPEDEVVLVKPNGLNDERWQPVPSTNGGST